MRPLLLVALLLLPLPAGAQDLTRDLEVAQLAAAERAARSVVLLEVERPNYGPRLLTQQERAALGVVGNYDPRLFSRPEGPAPAVVVGPGLVVASQWNVDGEGAITLIDGAGARFPARRLGTDPNLKLALLGVDAPHLVPIELAAEGPRVGQFAILVGRTDENELVVSTGLISGLGRYRGDAFTHSARTNYDTGGGAIVDLEGRLIGVSARHGHRSPQSQNSGVAFGAPVDLVRASLGPMAEGQAIPRRALPAFLGISADIEARDGTGVKVREVIRGTAAAAAGIKAGDWIRVFNSAELRDFGNLREEIEKLEPGTEIIVTVRRGEEELDIKVVLGSREE